MGWEQLHAGITLPIDPSITVPPLTRVELPVPAPPSIPDVEGAAREEVVERFADAVAGGMTVAVGAGSRGLTARVELLRGAIAGLRDLGAAPFVVPAMGSHGGATAEGQLATLEKLGMTADALDCEIRSTMETVVVARDVSGRPLHLDVHAASADRVLAVNRIKPHTAFRGPIESGCTKMLVVGFGKQPGAAQFHSSGALVMREQLLEGVMALRAAGRVLGGVASIEAPSGDVVTVRALTADEVGGPAEVALTDESRGLVAALPFPEIDVLIIEEGGKDISGTTLDPNVTGRFWVNNLPDLPVAAGRDDRVAQPDRGHRRQRHRHRVRRLRARGAGRADRLGADVRQLVHRRRVGGAAGTHADGAARRGVLHPGGAADVRQAVRRAEEGGAHPLDAAPHPLLGQRAAARRAPARRPGGRRVSSFFTASQRPDGSEWFAPTELARGPWDPDACHGGPPTGLLVRALERAVPTLRLARIAVDFGRQVPMTGFTIVTEVARSGRATANTTAAILDADGKVRVTATGVHLAVAPTPMFEGRLDNGAAVTARFADAIPGEFPVRHTHGMRGFRDAVEVRYPLGEDNTPGATTLWMRTRAAARRRGDDAVPADLPTR